MNCAAGNGATEQWSGCEETPLAVWFEEPLIVDLEWVEKALYALPC